MKNRWTTENIPNLKGKTAIVTGSNSGIGFETAKAIAAKGASLKMAIRNIEKGKKAANAILKEFPDAEVTVSDLNLGSLASVRAFSENYIKENQRLDILINNAGVMMPLRD